MFECTLANGELFKKIIAALSDLVEQGNFMVDSNMISFQGMDSSHVSLVALTLQESGFEPYRCDHDIVLGVQFAALNKILKCMTAKDKLSIQAREEGDVISFIFESADEKRLSNFELKLNEIDQEQLGIPETVYTCTVRMPSNEFQRVCRDLSAIGDAVSVSVTKDGIKFSVNGDIGNGDVCIKGMMQASKPKPVKSEQDGAPKVKKESGDNDETQMDEDDDDDMTGQPSATKGNNQNDNEDDDVPTGNVDDDDNDNDGKVIISMEESVTQTFSLRYLNNFTKATGLSKDVMLRMGNDVPLEVEYKVANFGSLRYYLAPKIDDEE